MDPLVRLAFEAEWLDPSSGVLWRYQLFFYPVTGEVEMFDIKNRRHFLKRIRCDGLAADQFFVSAKVTVFSRALVITAYGDEATRRAIEARVERTLVLILPEAVDHTGQILDALHYAEDGSPSGDGKAASSEGPLRVANLRMAALSPAQAAEFAAGAPDAEPLAAALRRGPVVVLEVVGSRASARCAAAISAGGVLRCSPSPEAAAREAAFLFGPGRAQAMRSGPDSGAPSSVAIIKPHLLRERREGQALAAIQDQFAVTALRLLRLDRGAAGEFLEAYRGPLPAGEWGAAVEELASGPCLAVQVAPRGALGGDAVERLRALCGPPDPEIGRALRPASLRARLGKSKALNGLHCTDLAEDAGLESSYIFGGAWDE
ncbi:nucleoside diphosphate kinase [Raphidocelis subcapitata]|uniref:Nucleoside diphosphate kinase n=1 Tax=Raphidocelis subcapitata TaxID=307507 RepID=A0A2V0PI64_9CHLO|nr:nucleoside diphosphate kinase [Raphidocelis subcapitata]|eukprot:GBF99249.1 nucleoside diphosphate kinase [Raphidocelis subcapitata]